MPLSPLGPGDLLEFADQDELQLQLGETGPLEHGQHGVQDGRILAHRADLGVGSPLHLLAQSPEPLQDSQPQILGPLLAGRQAEGPYQALGGLQGVLAVLDLRGQQVQFLRPPGTPGILRDAGQPTPRPARPFHTLIAPGVRAEKLVQTDAQPGHAGVHHLIQGLAQADQLLQQLLTLGLPGEDRRGSQGPGQADLHEVPQVPLDIGLGQEPAHGGRIRIRQTVGPGRGGKSREPVQQGPAGRGPQGRAGRATLRPHLLQQSFQEQALSGFGIDVVDGPVFRCADQVEEGLGRGRDRFQQLAPPFGLGAQPVAAQTHLAGPLPEHRGQQQFDHGGGQAERWLDQRSDQLGGLHGALGSTGPQQLLTQVVEGRDQSLIGVLRNQVEIHPVPGLARQGQDSRIDQAGDQDLPRGSEVRAQRQLAAAGQQVVQGHLTQATGMPPVAQVGQGGYRRRGRTAHPFGDQAVDQVLQPLGPQVLEDLALVPELQGLGLEVGQEGLAQGGASRIQPLGHLAVLRRGRIAVGRLQRAQALQGHGLQGLPGEGGCLPGQAQDQARMVQLAPACQVARLLQILV